MLQNTGPDFEKDVEKKGEEDPAVRVQKGGKKTGGGRRKK